MSETTLKDSPLFADAQARLASFNPDEIVEYLLIVEQLALELLSQHKLSLEELRARRKQLFSDEISTIDAEIEKIESKKKPAKTKEK